MFGLLAYHRKSNPTSGRQRVLVLTVMTLDRHAPGRFSIPPFALWGLAAALPPCVVGFTFTVMWSGVQALEAKAAGKADAPSDAESKELVAKWSLQNYVRSAIVGSAAVLGAVAILS